MPRRIAIANHLSTEELLVRYRQATQAIERSHYQIIWLLAKGKTPLEVAQVTGYTRTWIYQLVKRYNQDGEKALADGRHRNPGREPNLTILRTVFSSEAIACGWSGILGNDHH